MRAANCTIRTVDRSTDVEFYEAPDEKSVKISVALLFMIDIRSEKRAELKTRLPAPFDNFICPGYFCRKNTPTRSFYCNGTCTEKSIFAPLRKAITFLLSSEVYLQGGIYFPNNSL